MGASAFCGQCVCHDWISNHSVLLRQLLSTQVSSLSPLYICTQLTGLCSRGRLLWQVCGTHALLLCCMFSLTLHCFLVLEIIMKKVVTNSSFVYRSLKSSTHTYHQHSAVTLNSSLDRSQVYPLKHNSNMRQ